MPNRILKESICASEKIASLSDFEFRLWVGLITQVDDAGRGDARPAIIKGRVFPLRERVTVKEIESALHGLAAKSCVSLYTVGGRPYFWFPTWSEHQRIRDCKPKYPGPDEADLTTCGELPQIAADCGLNPIQSNPNPNPNSNPSIGRAARFIPPTVEEVAAYCAERQNNVDPQKFVDHYLANGWVQGKGKPIKDWKATVRTWERNDFSNKGKPELACMSANPEMKKYAEELRRFVNHE